MLSMVPTWTQVIIYTYHFHARLLMHTFTIQCSYSFTYIEFAPRTTAFSSWALSRSQLPCRMFRVGPGYRRRAVYRLPWRTLPNPSSADSCINSARQLFIQQWNWTAYFIWNLDVGQAVDAARKAEAGIARISRRFAWVGSIPPRACLGNVAFVARRCPRPRHPASADVKRESVFHIL